MNNKILEVLAAAFGCTVDEISSMAAQVESPAELIAQLEKELQNMQDSAKQVCDEYVYGLAELKREQREFGRSRLAQFGKTFTATQCVKPRPYWLRIRSFCVRSPYG